MTKEQEKQKEKEKFHSPFQAAQALDRCRREREARRRALKRAEENRNDPVYPNYWPAEW